MPSRGLTNGLRTEIEREEAKIKQEIKNAAKKSAWLFCCTLNAAEHTLS